MKKRLKVSIVVPTYNEKENIKFLIDKIQKILKDNLLEIIVVDDNSPDKTWFTVLKIQKKNHKVRLYRRVKERGLTGALNFGLQKSRGNIIGWLDADLSHPPQYLLSMMKYLPAYDIVVASRYVKGGADRREKKMAVIFSWLINKLAQILISNSFKDYTSGFILAKREVFNNFKLHGDYGEYFIDMIAYFLKNNFKIKEIPYICVSRKFGNSKTGDNFFDFIKRGEKYVWLILKNFFLKFSK